MDTPGFISRSMSGGVPSNRNAYTAIAEADVNYDGGCHTALGSGDDSILEKMNSAQIPVFLILNKIDLLDKRRCFDPE